MARTISEATTRLKVQPNRPPAGRVRRRQLNSSISFARSVPLCWFPSPFHGVT